MCLAEGHNEVPSMKREQKHACIIVIVVYNGLSA